MGISSKADSKSSSFTAVCIVERQSIKEQTGSVGKLLLATALLLLTCLCPHLLLPLPRSSQSNGQNAEGSIRHLLQPSNLPESKSISDSGETNLAILYRIIGNDLPPRHSPSQSIKNLRFILEHEPQLPGCRKVWLLNRIVDKRRELEIIKLLEAHKQSYDRIPFDPFVYEKIEWRYQDFMVNDFLYSKEFAQLSQSVKESAVDHLYHDKNLYIMNNNGARNLALQLGRITGRRWILPFDGNCFLTAAAWKTIKQALIQYSSDLSSSNGGTGGDATDDNSDSVKYLVIPMARLTSNQVLLDDPLYRPPANEEPQIIFRNDSKEEFSLSMRYGRRSKIELLWRLGVLGEWENYSIQPWERQFWSSSPEAGLHRHVGWVARLFSGRRTQEIDRRQRNKNRVIGIRRLIDSLDERLMRKRGFHPGRLCVWPLNSTIVSQTTFNDSNRQPQWFDEIIASAMSSGSIRPMIKEYLLSNSSAAGNSGSNPSGDKLCLVLDAFRILTQNSSGGNYNHSALFSNWATDMLVNRLAAFRQPPPQLSASTRMEPAMTEWSWQQRSRNDLELLCLTAFLDNPIEFSLAASRLKNRLPLIALELQKGGIVDSDDIPKAMDLVQQGLEVAQRHGVS